MIRVELEVCPLCLGPATGCDPECPGNSEDVIQLLAEGTDRWCPGTPGRTYGPPEDCYPPEPGEWGGDVTRVTRSDTGALVPWNDLPEPTQDLACELLAEESYSRWCEEDTEADKEADRERDYR